MSAVDAIECLKAVRQLQQDLVYFERVFTDVNKLEEDIRRASRVLEDLNEKVERAKGVQAQLGEAINQQRESIARQYDEYEAQRKRELVRLDAAVTTAKKDTAAALADCAARKAAVSEERRLVEMEAQALTTQRQAARESREKLMAALSQFSA